MTDDVGPIAQELRSLRLAQDMSGGATFVVDPDLRMVSASGPDLAAAGMDGDALAGQPLTEILGPDAPPPLLNGYRAALAGEDADLEFVDRLSGRLFHVAIRPLLGADDGVIGAVARSTDLSLVRAQQAHLEHAASLNVMGVSTYDVRSGWHHDEVTLDLLGLDDAALEPTKIFERSVVAPDREALVASWGVLQSQGGRATFTYRVGDLSRVDAVRHIQCTAEAVVGADGRLLRVVSTQFDVTAAAVASAEVERARQQVLADRLDMVRDLSAVITRAPLYGVDVLQTFTDLAVAALGGGASIGELSADGSTYLRYAVSHQEPEIREEMARLWAAVTSIPSPVGVLRRQVVDEGRPWCSPDDPEWKERFERDEGWRPLPSVDHLIIVPVHNQGRVIGLLTLQHGASEGGFGPADVDLAQILADRVGDAVTAERARVRATRERERREAASILLEDSRSQRHGLVARLSQTETRERRLLAEAVHDEPIQLIAAARLRVMALGRRLDQSTGVRGADRPVTYEETARIGTILETAMERLRLLIVALSPHDLDDGLVAALGELADVIFRGTSTEVTCSGPESLPLTPEQQGAALLILREALVNALQHAQASRVVLRVQVEPTGTVLTVQDDGVGSADISPRKGHLGLVSMRARAQDAGGELAVRSAVAVGTTVVLSFPAAGPTGSV